MKSNQFAQLTHDLQNKVADDVALVINRTLALADDPDFPPIMTTALTLQGAAVALSMLAQSLARDFEIEPHSKSVMLAAFMVARVAANKDSSEIDLRKLMVHAAMDLRQLMEAQAKRGAAP